MEQSAIEHETELVDLTSLSLREVMSLDESILGHALRRLWQEADQPEELVARHDNSI